MKTKLLYAIIFIISFIILPSGFVFSSQSSPEYSDDTEYVYPTVPGTSAWRSFDSLDCKINATQVPPEKLKHMTTRALMETVLNYPLLINMWAFGIYMRDPQKGDPGFLSVLSYCDSLQELVKRPDAIEILKNEFDKLNKKDYEEYIKENRMDLLNRVTDIARIITGIKYLNKQEKQ